MNSINRNILKVLSVLLGDDNLVVIRNEGGLASQIAFWALGHELDQSGFTVRFDNSWFKSNGLDINGRFSRNFDFPKAFPHLRLNEASPFERFALKKINNFREGDLNDMFTPVYLGGFYDGTAFDRWNLVRKHQDLLSRSFEIDDDYLSDQDKKTLRQIEQDDSACGVHVRRGDLAVDHRDYGKSVSVDYFLRAVDLVRSKNENARFYFFSDEPQWVKENIANKLAPDVLHAVIEGNGSERGFVDLYLMSRCRAFISSQGAFAKYAKILGDPSRLIVEPSSRAIFDKNDDSVIVLDV